MSKYWIYSVFWWKLLWQDQITGKWIMMLWPWWCWWCQWCQWWWRWRFWSGFQTGVLVETAHRGKRWLRPRHTNTYFSFLLHQRRRRRRRNPKQQIFEKSKFTEKSKILHQEIQTISRRNPKKIFPKMLNLRISLNPKKSENPIYLLSENHFIFFLKIKQIKKSNAHAHTLDWCAFALDGVKRLPTNKAFIGAGLPLL